MNQWNNYIINFHQYLNLKVGVFRQFGGHIWAWDQYFLYDQLFATCKNWFYWKLHVCCPKRALYLVHSFFHQTPLISVKAPIKVSGLILRDFIVFGSCGLGVWLFLSMSVALAEIVLRNSICVANVLIGCHLNYCKSLFRSLS